MDSSTRSFGRRVLAIVLLAATVAGASYVITSSLIDTSRMVAHTHEVIASTELLQRTMVDMETGQRGFMLTGDEEFLDPFHEGSATFLDLVAETKELVRDNPQQVARLSSIELLFNQWLSSAGLLGIELRLAIDRGETDESAIAYMLQGLTVEGEMRPRDHKSGKDLMDEVRDVVGAMVATEEGLLVQRTAENKADAELAIKFAVFGTLIALTVATIAYWRSTGSTTRALKVSERRFQAAFDVGPAGMAVLDVHGRISRVNEPLCQMLGYTEAELCELSFDDVVHAEDLAGARTANREFIVGAKDSMQIEARLMSADGGAIPVMASAVLIRDRTGVASHVIVQVVDVSELHTANSQLRHLLQSREALIASVSHELRTPLTGVIGFAELLQDPNGRFSAAERAEMIQAIAKESADLSNIVEDLLTAAQVDFTNVSMTQDAFSLRNQAQQVVEGMGSPGAISVARPRHPIQALGNPARARQILRNLVVNAFRYGGETIRITFDSTDASACVEVCDDGLGVPEDMQDLIFEGFERGPETPGLAGSLGLGLALSRKLAELMNGTLTYHRRDGETVFRLTLPRAGSTDPSVSDEDPEPGTVVGSDVASPLPVETSERVASAEQPAAVAPHQG